MLIFNVTNQELRRVDNTTPATDSKDYLQARFTVTDDWNGATLLALWKKGTTTYTAKISGGVCTVPAEVLARDQSAGFQRNKVFVTLVGENGTKRITTNELRVDLDASGYADGETPAPVTPDAYAQYVQEIADDNAATVAEMRTLKDSTETAANVAFGVVQSAKNDYANALKGNVSGAIVRVDDVSPVEHTPTVKVRSKNLFNADDYTTEKDYSNGQMLYAISAENLVIGRTYTVVSSVPMGWFKISNSATGYSCVGKEDYTNGFTSYTFTHNRHEKIGDTWGLWLYINNQQRTAMYDLDVLKSMRICIVEGTEIPEYIPYTDLSTVTVRKCGKNLFDVGSRGDYHIISPNTTVSNGVINGEVLSSNSGHCINLKNKYPCGKYGVSFYYSDTMPRMLVRLYNGNGDVMTECSELSKVGFQYNDAYNAFFANTKSMVVDIPSTVAYWCLGFVFPVTDTAGQGAIVRVADIQVEYGDKVTKYEAPSVTTHTTAADGSVAGITSVSPVMTVLTDTDRATVDVEYNRDTNKVVQSLVNALAALGGTV